MDSRESLVSMIAAGRGIFLGPEIGVGGLTAAIDFYRLNERHNQFELFTIWKKQSEGAPTIHKFIELLQESTGLKAARARGRKDGRPRKLQPKEVKTIRALLKTAEISVQEVATRFGVSRSTLYRNKLA